VAANDLGLRTKGRPRAGAKKYNRARQTSNGKTSIRSFRGGKSDPGGDSIQATIDPTLSATVIGPARLE
jgi:hypothetical protein